MSGFDLLRCLVIGEAAIVGLLYVQRAVAIAFGLRRHHLDLIAPEFSVGRLLRLLGCAILLFDGAIDVAHRLGNPTFNWRTPVLQVAIICLITGYMQIDRKIVKAGLDEAAPAAGAAIERLVDDGHFD